jgi:acyl-CoA thioester hydrolase
MGFRQSVRVRYGDCDMQQVVFNANYFAYIDDAVDQWVRSALGDYTQVGFDFMVKNLTMEWSSPARYADVLDLDVSVSRWGRSSFDVTVTGAVAERPVFTAVVVYVSTQPGSATPVPVPDAVRTALTDGAA